MSFLWYRSGLSLLFGIEISFLVSRSLFGIEILHSVVQHLDALLPRINQCVLFRASTSCKMEVKEDLDTEKKTKKSRYPKKDISIPTKRVTRAKGGEILRSIGASGGSLCRNLGNSSGILFREYCFGEENSLSLTEFWGKLGEFCEKNSVSSFWHIYIYLAKRNSLSSLPGTQ